MDTISIYMAVLFIFIGIQIIRIFKKENGFLEFLKFDIDDPIMDFLVPVAIAFIFVGFFSQIFNVTIVASDYPVFFLFFYIGLLAPISEEIIFRGIFIGIPVSFVKKEKYWDIGTSLIILQAIFFAILHNNPSFLSFVLRFSLGMIAGALYLLRNKNIFPAFVFHLTYNWILIFNRI